MRPIGRAAMGVKPIELDEGDEVVDMAFTEEGAQILSITELGYGKRTAIEEYRPQSRGGKGIKAMNLTEKTGNLVSIQAVTDDNDLMIINRSGVTIRTEVKQIRLAGRATQGVRIINLREGDAIASVMAVPVSENEEDAEGVVAEGAVEGAADSVVTTDAPAAVETTPAEE